MAENIQYKHSDYSIRSSDPYALSKYRIILDWLPRTPNLSVLNAGCGSGEMTVLLAQNPSWQIDAIDVDPEAVRFSQELKQAFAFRNINVFQSSIEAHAAERSYDVIVFNDVLEHIADDGRAVKRLAEMVTPGGIVCISVPALPWLFGYHDEMLGHYRRYNKPLLVSRLSAWLDVQRCRYFGGTLIPIALLYSRVLRRAYPVGRQGERSVAGQVLNTLLALERRVALPLGTSLIALARSRVE